MISKNYKNANLQRVLFILKENYVITNEILDHVILWIHAFGSYCWNEQVNWRIENFGFEVQSFDWCLLPDGKARRVYEVEVSIFVFINYPNFPNKSPPRENKEKIF